MRPVEVIVHAEQDNLVAVLCCHRVDFAARIIIDRDARSSRTGQRIDFRPGAPFV